MGTVPGQVQMSESFNGFIVTMKEPIGEEYAEALKNAIMLLENVVKVEPITANLADDYLAKMQLKGKIRKAMWEFMDKELK
jgi:hypothetical protein